MINIQYRFLSTVCQYRTDRTSISNANVLNYISTENMRPDKQGVSIASSLPDTQSLSVYLKNDILISNIRPYFKKIWFSTKNGTCSNDVLVLKPLKNSYPKFLYYVLSDNIFFSYATVTSKGTKMPRGSKHAIMKYLVPNFSFSSQKHIADILSTYDDLIENNNRRITLLEQAAQELYKEWFVRFRFPGYENTKFENGLPSQWARVRFGSIIDIIDGDRGTNYPKQEDFLCSGYCVFLNTGNVTRNGFNFSSINYISKEKDLSLRKGKLSRNDVVLTTRGTIGNSAFYNQYVPFENIRINSGMVILRGKPGISQEYIYCLLNSEHWQKSILLYASGSAQPQLPIKDMRRIKIVKPDSSTLVTFTSIVKKYYDEIALLSSKNQTLRKQQELLLPRLMNGHWEV